MWDASLNLSNTSETFIQIYKIQLTPIMQIDCKILSTWFIYHTMNIKDIEIWVQLYETKFQFTKGMVFLITANQIIEPSKIVKYELGNS